MTIHIKRQPFRKYAGTFNRQSTKNGTALTYNIRTFEQHIAQAGLIVDRACKTCNYGGGHRKILESKKKIINNPFVAYL